MNLRVIKMGPPQYTDRGKKTLMLECECLACGVVKLFRKARVDSGKTKSCGCLKLKIIRSGEKYHDLIIIVEAPRMHNRAKSRQLYVQCKCGNKTLIPLFQWGIIKRCSNCQVK